jgi:hypothetical protein
MSIIDDQDLSKVVYNGTWVKGGSVNEYAGTVASSTNVGDSFTVTFKGSVHDVSLEVDISSLFVLLQVPLSLFMAPLI